jgi:chromosomal replication initiator protein
MELTHLSSKEIGRTFERDHTTVLHAQRSIHNRIDTDPAFAARVAKIRAALERGHSCPQVHSEAHKV